MKIKPVYILGAVITMLVATACPNKEVYIPDPDPYTLDTEEAVYTIVLNDLLSPSFRIIELAEVFSGYQDIRSEREKALRFVESYFDTRTYVYYEYMEINNWGRIDLLPDGSYTAVHDTWKRYWIAQNMNKETAIQSPEKHKYTSSSTAKEKVIWDMTASIADYVITMSELHVRYEDMLWGRREHLAEITVLEPLGMPMCNQGKRKIEPVSGKIAVRYRSENADKEFNVEFHEDHKIFILKDGSTREVVPETTHRYFEY